MYQFLFRSVDEQGKPRVIVGRVKAPYRHLVSAALKKAHGWLAYPYNHSFYPNQQAFYCSSLISEAYKQANHGKAIFHLYPMNFQDLSTNKLLIAWKNYFQRWHVLMPPQGFPGNNPGSLSREKSVRIVHYYGRLRRAEDS